MWLPWRLHLIPFYILEWPLLAISIRRYVQISCKICRKWLFTFSSFKCSFHGNSISAKAFQTVAAFMLPHFPHSIFSTLHTFHTPHSTHSAFSALLIFHIPHSALHTFHWTIQCRQFNEFITLPSVLLSCVFDFPPLLLQISLFPCDSRVSLIGSFTAGEQIFSEMSLINIIRK